MLLIPFTKPFRATYPRFSRTTLLFASFFAAFVVGFAYASWAMVCRAGRCPSAETLDGYAPHQTSKLYAADGRFMAELGLERRTIVRFDDIPPLLRQAFVVTEDKRFYHHAGIDWMRVPGALLVDIKKRTFSEGFSTITMQLARNIFPERISRDKTLIRKLKEAKVAREIEAHYSKNRILELYLNQIYLGNGAYGVGAASQRYFGKPLKQLNVAEMALLAALPKGPERYNPRKFPERATQRRNVVIALMRNSKLITPAAASEAEALPLELSKQADASTPAPYFIEWVRQQLDERFGQDLYEKGLKVYTTLDLDLQASAERSMEHQMRAIEAGHYGAYPHVSFDRYMSRVDEEGDKAAANSPYLQGAFIAMDPRTGGVLALIGGRDFDDNQFDRAVQAVRQPGSTFKPIVYADAVQSGRPLSYKLDDAPLTVPLSGNSTWTPQNFEGNYEGKISMRRALVESRNVPTIELGIELGTQSVIDEARRFGLTTPIPEYPSIFIGAADVYPIEMVSAYTAFATLGTRAAPTAITRVEDQDGNVIWQPEPTTVSVMTPDEAWLVVSMLKDVVRRGTAAGAVGSQFHYPAGGKTGTTNDGADVWFIGFTRDIVAGVWMGFDKPQKIKSNAQGGILAAPVWTAFMSDAYRKRKAPRDWPMPENVVAAEIDASTNMLATPYCPPESVTTEFFLRGTDPIVPCNVHTAATIVPDTSGFGVYPPAPGGVPIVPIDTSRRPRDSAIFPLPPRDTLRPRSTRPRDSLRIPDTARIRPRPVPDSGRVP
jgi:penicillin-binding protein 1A